MLLSCDAITDEKRLTGDDRRLGIDPFEKLLDLRASREDGRGLCEPAAARAGVCARQFASGEQTGNRIYVKSLSRRLAVMGTKAESARDRKASNRGRRNNRRRYLPLDERHFPQMTARIPLGDAAVDRFLEIKFERNDLKRSGKGVELHEN